MLRSSILLGQGIWIWIWLSGQQERGGDSFYSSLSLQSNYSISPLVNLTIGGAPSCTPDQLTSKLNRIECTTPWCPVEIFFLFFCQTLSLLCLPNQYLGASLCPFFQVNKSWLLRHLRAMCESRIPLPKLHSYLFFCSPSCPVLT